MAGVKCAYCGAMLHTPKAIADHKKMGKPKNKYGKGRYPFGRITSTKFMSGTHSVMYYVVSNFKYYNGWQTESGIDIILAQCITTAA